jgi:hypothetical protein
MTKGVHRELVEHAARKIPLSSSRGAIFGRIVIVRSSMRTRPTCAKEEIRSPPPMLPLADELPTNHGQSARASVASGHDVPAGRGHHA